jgi:crystallin alpha B
MVPLFFRDWWADDFDRERPARLLDQHFGMGLKRDDLLKNFSDLSTLRSGRYLRPWGALPLARSSSGSSNLKFDLKKKGSHPCNCF